MTRGEIAKELKSVTGEQAFITATQLTRALGRVDAYKVKREFLKDLESIGGRYLIIEVADALKRRAKL